MNFLKKLTESFLGSLLIAVMLWILLKTDAIDMTPRDESGRLNTAKVATNIFLFTWLFGILAYMIVEYFSDWIFNRKGVTTAAASNGGQRVI